MNKKTTGAEEAWKQPFEDRVQETIGVIDPMVGDKVRVRADTNNDWRTDDRIYALAWNIAAESLERRRDNCISKVDIIDLLEERGWL